MASKMVTTIAAAAALGAVAATAVPASAQPWGYYHRPFYGYGYRPYGWRRPFYGLGPRPFYGPGLYGYYRPHYWRPRYYRY